MLFNSWAFLILCLITLPLYYAPLGWHLGKVWQILVLLAASAIFYAWEKPSLLILLGLSCLLNAIAVERIIFWKAQGSTPRAKHWLIATVTINLGFLAFFKYASFFVSFLPIHVASTGLVTFVSEIPLPVGISFYTFQGISLVVDVWRDDISRTTRRTLSGRKTRRLRSIRDVMFYISFFPQLVAGPIVKAHEFVDQIGVKRFADINWVVVRRNLIAGYFLKIFVADNLAEQTASLTLGAEHLSASSPLNLLPLLYCYSLQIFADFAGYSLIAIGLGALFGYRLPTNFNFPYISTSITEFWRRWHLSLSSWLRDYLYIPLGGSRLGTHRTYFNLFMVMFLGGLWHGAAWKFALWGSLHGVFLALERLRAWQRPELKRAEPASPSAKTLESAFIRWFVTFHLVTLLWLTFMMPDMESVVGFFRGIFFGTGDIAGPPLFSLLFYGAPVAVYHVWGWLCENRPEFSGAISHTRIEPALHGFMIFLLLTNPGAPRGFIYFQF